MEEWKDIAGYEGLYKVSNMGKVKSLPKFGNGDGKSDRVLKVDVSKKTATNYYRVTLSKNGKTKRFQVHRLVAGSFIENTSNKPYVNHIDNNGENNQVDNLEWVTHSENMIHSQRQGRQFANQSKAGKAAGVVLASKAKFKHLSNIGKVFGEWTFLSVTQESLNWKGIFRCSCGTEKEVNISTVISGKSKNCRSCGLKRAHREKKIKI